MIVRTSDGLFSEPRETPAATTVIYADSGEPIAIFSETSDGIVMRTAQHTGFAHTLRAMGVPERAPLVIAGRMTDINVGPM